MKFKNPDLRELKSKEWIVTNGLGSYASSTICCCNTRRYHGLLVASFNPPTDRKVLVSKIDEAIHTDDSHFELGTNRFMGAIHPEGYKMISEFERDPFPKITWKNHKFSLSKTIFMVYGRNTTVVEYINEGKKNIRLDLNLQLNFRDYHGMMRENSHTDFYQEEEDGCITIYPQYGAGPLYITHSGDYHAGRNWHNNYFYDKEDYRGLDAVEDTFSPGAIQIQLKPGEHTFIGLSLREHSKNQNFPQWKKNEKLRLTKLETSDTKFINDLLKSGNQFIVKRKSTGSHTLLAGYHWFTDWGRDTMIAMRHLCIEVGEREISKSIIQTFLIYLNNGMLPNRFPDSENDNPEYNTIDATLWLFIVLYEYHQKFKDTEFIKETVPKLEEIIRYYINGTHFGIHQTDEGLIYGGEGISQLTWMDARVGDKVVTPRHGCPVEIQALWYNALKIFLEFEKVTGFKSKLSKTARESAKKLKENFSPLFLNSDGYLNDVVIPGEIADDSLRPNQVYVLSLPYRLLTRAQERKVLNAITEKLYTPYGLRTLEMDHHEFKPVYEGSAWNRDHAYHQGTVWPFLLSDYFTAWLRINGDSSENRDFIASELDTLKTHFYENECIHGVSEIFDGEDPGEGRGTIQQAWSAGALLKMAWLSENGL